MHLVFANLDFTKGHNREFLAWLCEKAAVVPVCEAKDVDLETALPAGWATNQVPAPQDKAGSAVNWQTGRIKVKGSDLIPGSPKGDEVLARWISYADCAEIDADGERTSRYVRVFAVHVPLRKTGLQDEYMASLRAAVKASPYPVIVAGDFNQRHTTVADYLGLESTGGEVVGICYSPKLELLSSHVDWHASEQGWTDHPTVHARIKLPARPEPEPAPEPTAVERIIAVAKSQVGVHEGYSGGHWNNNQRYSDETPGLEWSDGQPWCAVFVSWCAMKADIADLYPRTASCDVAGGWFKQRRQWSEYPAVGAQVFFGYSYDLNHTGLVVDYDADWIWTVEGNTNDDGSREGDGVYLKKRARRGTNVIGYGYPDFPEGIKSADPAFR